jgi:hypothetical protein
MKTIMQKTKRRTYMSAGRKLLVVLFSLGLALGASAQRGGGHVGGGYHGGFHGGYHHGGVVFARPYVGIGLGYGWGLGWGYPWYGPYGPWGPYPAYYYGYGAMPTQLQLQIDGIKNDYKAEIKDVKHDKALTHKEKRQKIDQLEQDRDAAVIQARKDYFYNNSKRYNHGQQPNNGNGQQPKNGNGSSSNSNGNDQPEYQDKGPANSK